jgi:Leucine-rich repeat (LRR) protein
MSKLTWLHLSDIHIKEDALTFDRNRVFTELYEQIEREKYEGRIADIIFITGDLAATGTEYVNTTGFLDKLTGAAGIGKHNVFIVPGNHDVDMNLLGFKLNLPRDAEDANLRVSQRNISVLMPRFKSYKSFYDKYFEGIRTFSTDEPFHAQYVELPNLPGEKIGIVCLNTCLYSQKNKSHGNLWVGTEATEKALKLVKDARIIFVLHHHPLSWVHEEEQLKLELLFSKYKVISLYGHLHKPHIEFTSNQHGQLCRFCTGALHKKGAFFRHALWGTADLNRGCTTIKAIQFESDMGTTWQVHKLSGQEERELPLPGSCNYNDRNCGISPQLSQDQTKLSEAIKKVISDGLSILEFRRNKIENWDDELWKLSDLEQLNVSHNSLSDIPKDIEQLTKLKELDLRSNQLKGLPKEIGALVNLEKLFLSSNTLENPLPTEIWSLPKLQVLCLQWNKLSSLPSIARVSRSSSLTALELHQNQLKELPPGIGTLSSLKKLVLTSNALTKLPPEIGTLANLEVLFLSRNKLEAFPCEIGMLKELVTLEASENSIAELPPEIGNLKKLKTLELKKNGLSKLPVEMRKLAKLEILDLTANNINSFDPRFKFPVNLINLCLSDNKIKELPASLNNLKRLKTLALSNNPINDFPEALLELPQLEKLLVDKKQKDKWKDGLESLMQLRADNLQVSVLD